MLSGSMSAGSSMARWHPTYRQLNRSLGLGLGLALVPIKQFLDMARGRLFASLHHEGMTLKIPKEVSDAPT